MFKSHKSIHNTNTTLTYTTLSQTQLFSMFSMDYCKPLNGAEVTLFLSILLCFSSWNLSNSQYFPFSLSIYDVFYLFLLEIFFKNSLRNLYWLFFIKLLIFSLFLECFFLFFYSNRLNRTVIFPIFVPIRLYPFILGDYWNDEMRNPLLMWWQRRRQVLTFAIWKLAHAF